MKHLKKFVLWRTEKIVAEWNNYWRLLDTAENRQTLTQKNSNIYKIKRLIWEKNWSRCHNFEPCKDWRWTELEKDWDTQSINLKQIYHYTSSDFSLWKLPGRRFVNETKGMECFRVSSRLDLESLAKTSDSLRNS